MAMFIHFFCLCALGLTIKLNFNISKVAYSFIFGLPLTNVNLKKITLLPLAYLPLLGSRSFLV